MPGMRPRFAIGLPFPPFTSPLRDHLGSTSVTRSDSGILARQTYYPFGTVRTTDGTLPTDYTFTGQKLDSYINLLQMGARWYDPSIGRWIQPDSIIPDVYNPQSLNRYSYVLNNPLKYTDPSGHGECEDADCQDPLNPDESQVAVLTAEINYYGADVDSDFSRTELGMISQALSDFAAKVGGVDAARKAIGGVHFAVNHGEWLDQSGQPYAGSLNGLIRLPHAHFHQAALRTALGPMIGTVHELAHYWDWKETNPISRLLGLGDISSDIFSSEKGPTQYGRSSLKEEWAESVAMWVYPQYSDILRSEADPLENPLDPAGRPKLAGQGGPGLGPNHTLYLMRRIFMLGGWK